MSNYISFDGSFHLHTIRGWHGTLRRVMELSPRYIIPNHYDGVDGEKHAREFATLLERRADNARGRSLSANGNQE